MRFFLSCLLLLGFSLAACAEDYGTPKIDSHGIKVWTFSIPNYPLRAFRATAVVKSSLGGLVELITDTDTVPDWAYHVDKIDMIKRDDTQQTFVIRAKLNFWPLKARDTYIQGRVTQDPKTLVVDIDSENVPAGVYPEDRNFVRMPDMHGRWELKPLGGGLVEITMTGHADPGGAIPKFLVNMLMQENPYNTLLGVQKMIGKDRYQKVVLKQIREPGQ